MGEMKTRYRCEFSMHGISRHVSADSLAELKDGFWITAQYGYTTGIKARYWIPPSQIFYIAKDQEAP